VLAFASPALARAHGDLHFRIAELGAELARHPEDAALWLERAELWRRDGTLDSAEADLARATLRDPRMPRVPLLRGALRLSAGRALEAESALGEFLAIEPGHLEALRLRATARSALGRFAESAEDRQAVARGAGRVTPEDFVDWARALEAAGRPAGESLAAYDAGVRRLGSTPALEAPALALERAGGFFDAAISRLARMRAWMPAEQAAAELGETHRAAGRTLEARAAFTEALARIDALAPRRRARLSTRELEQRVSEALRVLESQEQP
jgi:tetratricopeptide (TPR) repeat protein